MTVKKIIKVFEKEISKNEKIIDKFKESFDKHPLKAMTWQGEAFAAIVKNDIFKKYLQGLENHGNVEALIAFALNQVKLGVLYPSNSTSIFSNFEKQQELCAEALALEILEGKYD